MSKNLKIIIGIIIVIVVIGGGYAIFHKSPKKTVVSISSSTNAPAVNNAVLITKTNSSGSYLAEPNGQPLYTYNGDSNGVSKVTGSLLASWPAYQDTGSTTGLPTGVGTIKRTDNGQIQFTYNGLPLYTFVADSPGNVTGDGVSNFTVAKPASSSSSSSSSSGSSTSTGASTQSSNSNTSSYYP